nr:GntR family transcriptional regulator [Conexibacter arvalis]
MRARVTGGELAAGERLPGARELAAHVGVNVNTVRAVYARLEEEGLLEVVHGRGTFVADRAAPLDAAARFAAAVESEARRRGIDPRAVAAALYVQPADQPGADDDPAIRRALREEISRLERRLASLPAVAPGDDPFAPSAQYPSDAGRLLTRAELERQRDELAERVAEAADAGAAEAARSARAAADARPAAGGDAAARGRSRDPSTLTRNGTLRWVPGS